MSGDLNLVLLFGFGTSEETCLLLGLGPKIKITGGSDLKKDKIGGHGGGHGGPQRLQVHSWLQRLSPFGQKKKKNLEDLSILKKVKNYLILNTPYSDLLVRVHELDTKLQAEVASDSEDSE
ncbi:putative ral guanine nucleotide dissociation stimulator-like [Microtus ochrogaster]|uniref:Putative ral guanine nucleotide dissociation stimulator-like n=1 Tax=Microtus ochrogaster TaxID=79684 RepID=A0A8J6H2Y2_MICOH|nr:putative ral guanine nucleotide dissociation stimulator-like [Microtus ochrogaster]